MFYLHILNAQLTRSLVCISRSFPFRPNTLRHLLCSCFLRFGMLLSMLLGLLAASFQKNRIYTPDRLCSREHRKRGRCSYEPDLERILSGAGTELTIRYAS